MKKTYLLLFILSIPTLYAQQNGATLGMKLESATVENGKVAIITTGARFELDARGDMQCSQRIPRERRVLEVSFGHAVGPFKIQKKDGFSCTVSCRAGTLEFHGDSVVILRTGANAQTTFHGLFQPAYHFEKQGKWILIDPDGGFGIYPVAKKQSAAPDFTKSPWSITYQFAAGDEAWLSVFPPRPFNWKRASEAIEHDGLPAEETKSQLEGVGAYPGNDVIASAAKVCKVYCLHAYIWQDAPEDLKKKLMPIKHTESYAGHPQPWLASKFVPLNMQEFIRVRDQVHKHGMKLVVYVSPYYSGAPDIIPELQRILKDYQLDGLYFDGISMDFRKSYEIIRRTREILGDNRILYAHCSSDPLNDGRIYCPFIDTYADYILRGEAGVWGLKPDDFLRYTLSGYNISNAVGYWCYYGSNRQQGYGGAEPKSGKYFDVVPTKEAVDGALRNRVYIWREGQEWGVPASNAALAQFDRYYYSKVALLPH